MAEFDAYKKIVAILKDKCSTAFPMNIRRVKMTDDLQGYCHLNKRRFDIRINRDLPEITAIDTVLHEVAHAVAWNHLLDSVGIKEWEERLHDATWGVAYSEVYRIYEKYWLKPLESQA